MKARIHQNVKHGDVLRFAKGDLKVALRTGYVNVVRTPNGLARPKKLNKKERKRQRLAAKLQSAQLPLL